MNKTIFRNNLLETVDQIMKTRGLAFQKIKFKIAAAPEDGKPLNSTDDIMRLIMLSEKNVGSRLFSIDKAASLLAWKEPFVPIWVDVSFLEIDGATGIFKLDVSLRLRKPSQLRNVETGHPPFKAIYPTSNYCETCLLRMDMDGELPITKCQHCGLLTYKLNVSNGLQAFSCSKCGMGCVATYLTPCTVDDNCYMIFLQLNESASLETVHSIVKIFGAKYTDIYKRYRSGKTVKFKLSLKDVLEKTQALEVIDVLYEVSPELLYSDILKCRQKGII
ncbi:MAG: hypothetical protein ACRDBO_16165 [Lachnospiraceae bacterium]